MNGFQRAGAVARKDLLLEWRGRQTVTAMVVFALLVTLLLGFALGGDSVRASAILWIALGLAAMLGAGRPMLAEAEGETLEALLLYPGSREHLYWGKCAALGAMLLLLWAALLPLAGILFNLDLWDRLPALLGVGALGVAGLAALGTLFAALAVHVRGRELLMPLLLLPVSLPVVLAGVRLTEATLTREAPGLWLGLLAAFDVLFLLTAPLLFEVLMEDA
ncbi:MAG TPA: heme exporter protein CcmB [bacterium]|jgi:heme exporter protein B|nr:heme exporter protein CcmB [bacterium]